MVVIRLVDLVELASHPGMIQAYAAPAQSIESFETHKHDNSYTGFRINPNFVLRWLKNKKFCDRFSANGNSLNYDQ